MGASCQKESELPPLEDKQLTVLELQCYGCKENEKSTDLEQYIELKAEDENKLRLKFSNATLNCAGLDTTYAAIDDGVLNVTFVGNWQEDCICEFDLECLLDSMENRSYNIEVYVSGDEPKAQFSFVYSSNLDLQFDIVDN
jgi:hypothetical protein